MSGEVGVEKLYTALTTLFPCPALVLGEAPELAVEPGAGVGLETFEAGPDTDVVVVTQRSGRISFCCSLTLDLVGTASRHRRYLRVSEIVVALRLYSLRPR